MISHFIFDFVSGEVVLFLHSFLCSGSRSGQNVSLLIWLFNPANVPLLYMGISVVSFYLLIPIVLEVSSSCARDRLAQINNNSDCLFAYWTLSQ